MFYNDNKIVFISFLKPIPFPTLPIIYWFNYHVAATVRNNNMWSSKIRIDKVFIVSTTLGTYNIILTIKNHINISIFFYTYITRISILI